MQKVVAALGGNGIRSTIVLLFAFALVMVLFAVVFGPEPVWATFRELIGLTAYPDRGA